ncbi:MAG: YitT family protein, partial [Clostridia bacterium]|nr:YitT family protein [Clostridia bacterium]
LFPGGFTGLSLLIQECLLRYAGIRVPYSALSLTLNFLAAALCFRYIGKRFALFSVLASARRQRVVARPFKRPPNTLHSSGSAATVKVGSTSVSTLVMVTASTENSAKRLPI